MNNFQRCSIGWLWLLAAASLTPSMGSAQEPTVRIILDDDFGDADPENIVKTLESTAQQLLKHTPDRRLATIIVRRSQDVPISLYKKGEQGEYQIRLNVRDRYWAQHAYQFAHEMGHVLCNYDLRHSGDNLWFEECLCETASLYALRQLATAWETKPPYANWKDFAPKFTVYANELLARRDRRLPPDLTLPQWYRKHVATLRSQKELTEHTKLLATYLLPLFEDDPSGWAALEYLNRDEQDGERPFPEYLAAWKSRCPEKQQAFVGKIQTLLGVE